MRTSSALSQGFRPVRGLFTETRQASTTYWSCKLCDYTYFENHEGGGWPLSVNGLFHLVRHLKGHTVS
jgi:hypothetical protein